jgi:hypothetical protein
VPFLFLSSQRRRVRTFAITDFNRRIENRDDTAAIPGLHPSALRVRMHELKAGEKRCSGTFGSWLHAFPGETRTSPEGTSSMTPNLRKIRNCRVLEVLLPGFGNATSGLSCLALTKVSLNILRFHQILRATRSFLISLLFSSIILIPCY